MKDYKLLLAGLILLLLIVVIAVLTWLWMHNRKNIDPLPIMANENEPTSIAEEENEETATHSVLHIQAEESLKDPLDDIVAGYKSRYPHVQVLTNYVTDGDLLALSSDSQAYSPHTDMIIANDRLSSERLAPLQASLTSNRTQAKPQTDGFTTAETSYKDQKTDTTDHVKARSLVSFGYALKDTKVLEGVILTDSTVAISFRNFLLSSVGQDVLKKYDYYNIDGYKNSVDDLFNPTSRAKKSSDENLIDVSEVLSNGK